MSTTSRWLTWTPKGTPAGPIIEKTPEPEPPKPPKTCFEGFAGAPLGLFQKIGPPERKPECVPGAVELTGPEMARQVSRWMAARCVRSSRAWGAEKFLYRDYLGWCQQSSQPAISQEQFVAILDETFQRDGNGWQGLCLATDWGASEGSGRQADVSVTAGDSMSTTASGQTERCNRATERRTGKSWLN